MGVEARKNTQSYLQVITTTPSTSSGVPRWMPTDTTTACTTHNNNHNNNLQSPPTLHLPNKRTIRNNHTTEKDPAAIIIEDTTGDGEVIRPTHHIPAIPIQATWGVITIPITHRIRIRIHICVQPHPGSKLLSLIRSAWRRNNERTVPVGTVGGITIIGVNHKINETRVVVVVAAVVVAAAAATTAAAIPGTNIDLLPGSSTPIDPLTSTSNGIHKIIPFNDLRHRQCHTITTLAEDVVAAAVAVVAVTTPMATNATCLPFWRKTTFISPPAEG
mmetsp:Transcript_24011/g.56627  ORF Transcript_24011/g.56627 Transcript_24011/m.56627 type:complete len:274 (+) Transcript_24011:185-1006(+)